MNANQADITAECGDTIHILVHTTHGSVAK